MFFPLSCNDNNYMNYKCRIPHSLISKRMQIKRIVDNFRALFFNWQIGAKNLTKRKFIVWPSFFTSWTITSVMHTGGRTCKKTKVYIYLYISLYENLFENGCVYIYISSSLSRCLEVWNNRKDKQLDVRQSFRNINFSSDIRTETILTIWLTCAFGTDSVKVGAA